MKDTKSKKEDSNNSFDSIPELSVSRRKYFKYCFLLLIIIIFLNGIYLIIYKAKYLITTFYLVKYLTYFIYLYSFGIITSFIITLPIVLIVIFIALIKNKFKTKKTSLPKNEESPNEDWMYFNNEENINFMSYTFTIYIIVNIVFYLLDILFGSYLLFKIIDNNVYKIFLHYIPLYSFILLNILSGLSIFGVIIFMLIGYHTNLSSRQTNYHIENLDLENIAKEVKNAIKVK